MKNFPAQQQIFQSSKRFKIVAKGRRFGLTRGAANDYIEQALQRQFQQGLWVDTVNSNIDRYVERYFLPALRKLPPSMYEWKKQSKVLYILDSFIDFRSVDRPENIEGFGYDKAFLNEAGIILKDQYLWENAIKPMLWEYNPRTVIGGTPKGINEFYKLALRGKDPSQSEYDFFQFSTFDNPLLSQEVVRSIQQDIKNMPENVVKQEIYGEFVENAGMVFRGMQSIMSATPKEPEIGRLYVIGVDLAKVQDYTVLVVYDRSTKQQVYQDRFHQVDWPLQKKRIRSVAHHYNNALVVIDATGLGSPIVDDLLRDGVAVEPYKFTFESKKELIEKLQVEIEQKRIKMLPIAETLAEFNAFEYDVSSKGRISYASAPGFHDDIVMAHGLAVSSLTPLYPEAKIEELSLVAQKKRKLTSEGFSYESDYAEDEW